MVWNNLQSLITSGQLLSDKRATPSTPTRWGMKVGLGLGLGWKNKESNTHQVRLLYAKLHMAGQGPPTRPLGTNQLLDGSSTPFFLCTYVDNLTGQKHANYECCLRTDG